MKMNQVDHANEEPSEQRDLFAQQQENANEYSDRTNLFVKQYEQQLENLETEQVEIGDPIVMPHSQNLDKYNFGDPVQESLEQQDSKQTAQESSLNPQDKAPAKD